MPFTIEQFLQVFRDYNNSIWPLQVALYVVALVAVFTIYFRKSYSAGIVNLILAMLWMWMGTVYHLLFFSAINPASYLFGALFILQGLLFLIVGVFTKGILEYKNNVNLNSILGIVLILFALIIYPALSYLLGHRYPAMPTFGLPCPTTIFTFGILLFASKKIPWYVIVIPFLWSLVGFSAAVQLQIREDFSLLVTGITVTAILLFYKPGIKFKMRKG